ncbi:hypothetical protein [Kitasatospora sp. DSM 101779]|uniref:hypothetical protein n=1 Tax=Kitasatospora sp. DSM 101779 TaxID=2853165 RepID=UPI0021D89701|nr:hypothetical protein [Kitasatospora sp. DSM 101779]MCU7820941.1 hypothetical protein [Kitasatospora sp. DSM 101779]
MATEEKRAWIMVLVTLCSYAAYAAVVLGRAGSGPLAATPYRAALLWSVGLAIAASIVLHITVSLASKESGRRKDQRDREIHRFGEYVGQSFLVIGGVAALVLAMARADHFWIANAAYLAFVLSALLGSAAKIVAYRRGFGPW